jgi:flagellar hook-associated protein 2
MGSIATGVGLISGLNFREIVDQLISVDSRSLVLIQNRQKNFQSVQAGLKTLSANLLTLATSASQLTTSKNFSSYRAQNSDPAQMTATIEDGADVGNHELQSLRLASTHQLISKGFANADQQTIGAGKITISAGGRLQTQTSLTALNGGAGVRRGTIKITDRSGASADVDLTAAATVTDVINSINSAAGISVAASAEGDKVVIRDTTGQSVANLTVADKLGGHTAIDLGINQSVASASLSGTAVYRVSTAFTLSYLNDGNQARLADNLPDLQISLTDAAGTKLDVDLNGALTLGEVIDRINNHTGNGGKLTASLSNGRLQLVDNTGGGGSSPLTVTDLNGSNITSALGLNTAASGATLSGKRLVAGINSVLLRNLRGGAGVSVPGQIALTDRAGRTATVDLSSAESLDEVLAVINQARDGQNVKLSLSAEINATGNGIEIKDTSGSTASNLIIADVGAGTLATQLGIAINAAQTAVNSGSLNLRYVGESASLATYAPGATAVRTGGFGIVDSLGKEHFVNLNDTHKTIGDVIKAVNQATGGKVTAELNSTGDGFVLIDQAGGTSQLSTKEIGGGKSAADLRILGTGAAGGDGKSRIVSRLATVIDVAATDTLNSVRDKLNAAKAGFSAAILDDGTAFSPKRLLLTSSVAGSAGRFLFDDGGLGLSTALRSDGADALLRVGANPETAFLLSSSTNHFDSVVPGLDIDLLSVGDDPAFVDVVRDTGKVADMIKKFIDGYNDVIKRINEMTKFDVASNARGILQGEGISLRLTSALHELTTGSRFGPADSAVRSLVDMGINVQADGTLSADTFGLQIQVAQKGEDINKFFLDLTNGFGAKLKRTVESFTDPLTGKIAEQTNSLQASVDSADQRIETLSALLESRRQRLLNEFVHLETVLGGLQSQQNALTRLQQIASVSSGS